MHANIPHLLNNIMYSNAKIIVLYYKLVKEDSIMKKPMKINIFLVILTVSVSISLILLTACDNSKQTYTPSKEKLEGKEMYKNPIIMKEKTVDGAADPFVMRYNGWYYLYTTGSVNIWKSKNLVDWTYVGTANNEKPLNGAFAPEVYYWNGKFYMYTSPNGKGHYILAASSPEGPFEYATDNLGLSIDGSVFIDDDGSWYFTHADSSGIIGNKMNSPTDINYGGKPLNAYLGYWTEGPMIIKRDDIYYLTYTGNHYQSKGYRVAYAVSTDGPLGKYTPSASNPIVINNAPNSFGLGHSSTVLGPDLDSYYMAYHSYNSPYNNRVLNVSRLFFNGSRMYVSDVTNSEQPVPSMPDFAAWLQQKNDLSMFDKINLNNYSAMVSKETTGKTYTAEFNFSTSQNEDCGILWGYNNNNKYLSITWNKNSNKVIANKVTNGEVSELGSFNLPEDFKPTVLHNVRIQCSDGKVTIFFDEMKKLTLDNQTDTSGKIGYLWAGSDLNLGFTGFSSNAYGSSDEDVTKMIPGSFDAVHHEKISDNGISEGVKLKENQDKTSSVILDKKGQWLSYVVDIKEKAKYGIALTVKKDIKNSEIDILIDGKKISSETLKNNIPEVKDDWIKLPLKAVELPQGLHTLTVRLSKGNIDLLALETYKVTEQGLPSQYTLKENNSGLSIIGTPVIPKFTKKGVTAGEGSDIKLSAGDRGLTDYSVEAEYIAGNIYGGNAGLSIRMTNESYHSAQNYNAMMGYFASFNGGEIILRKMNYEATKKVATKSFDMKAGTTHKVRLTAHGNTISVYVDDTKKPIIEYKDPNPYLYGKAGVWLYNSDATLSNLKVKKLE